METEEISPEWREDFLYDLCRIGHISSLNSFIRISNEKGYSINFDKAFEGATSSNNFSMVALVIYKANEFTYSLNFNMGLIMASTHGHKDMIELMYELGARSVDGALCSACSSGYKEIAEFLIAKYNANDFDMGLMRACLYEHPELAELMISHGVSNLNEVLLEACDAHNLDIIKLLVKHGANNYNEVINELEKRRPKERRYRRNAKYLRGLIQQ
jgi:ankyrin repeat protein